MFARTLCMWLFEMAGWFIGLAFVGFLTILSILAALKFIPLHNGCPSWLPFSLITLLLANNGLLAALTVRDGIRHLKKVDS